MNINNTFNNERAQLIQWLNSYSFSHFLTIDLPIKLQHIQSFDNAISHFRQIISKIERELLGRRWNLNPIPFIAFTEKGPNQIFHWHILLQAGEFSIQQIQSAINNTINRLKLNPESIYIDTIDQSKITFLFTYVTKELKNTSSNHLDTNKIFTADILFNP